jgi:hypothetical protein
VHKNIIKITIKIKMCRVVKVPYEIVDNFENTSFTINSLSKWPAEANEVKAKKKKRYEVKEPMVCVCVREK